MRSSLGFRLRRQAMRCAGMGVIGAVLVPPHAAANAQSSASAHIGAGSLEDSAGLDSIVARALAVNPTLIAARQRMDAARAGIGPAGARPDPMLMAGIQNKPLGPETPTASEHGVVTGGRDPMTMYMVGASQTIPFPGKLGLRTSIAQHETSAADAALDDTRLGVIRDVRTVYYELAYLDEALQIVDQNRTVLTDVIRVTEAHYATGSGMQQDVLKARLAITRLAQQANDLQEERRAQRAALNALLDRPDDTPVANAAIPERIARAAVADSGARIRFASSEFGASAAGSPLPSLATLQDLAVANSPMLREHEANIAAQTARVELAATATRPDIDLTLQYGHRPGLADMLSAVVSVPIPIQHRRNQDEDVAAAQAELAALEAQHHASVNDLRARLAKLYADIERARTQLALDVKAILPQGRASLAAATAGYQAGKTDLLTLLDSQSTLFAYQTAYFRSLADFAEAVAELDAVVGKEVLQ